MNILRTFHLATAEEMTSGLTWYRDGLETAARLVADARKRGEVVHKRAITRNALAGILAALSPQKSWSRNLGLLLDLLAGRPVGQFATQVAKARAILGGRAPLDVLVGPKERAFYLGFTDPNTEAVTIDGHAYSVWQGQRIMTTRVKITAALFRLAAADYATAADQVGLRPHQIQAITWLTHRRIHNSTGHVQDQKNSE